jgi:hypothetical protein
MTLDELDETSELSGKDTDDSIGDALSEDEASEEEVSMVVDPSQVEERESAELSIEDADEA